MRRLLPVLALLVLAGCGSSSSSSTSSTSSTSTLSASGTTPSTSTAAKPAVTSATTPVGKPVVVVMKGLAFIPKTVRARVGQTVTWTNQDGPPHNVTYVSGPVFTSSGRLNPGATYKITLHKAGTIQYFCSIHPFMTATIVVLP